ncbi:MAG: hypothetical protein J6V05_04445 [Alistipes sp.]|nr:hypothetical protein [Alistipes sp.]
MDLKLNVQKRGLSATTETINEEFTLHYGHIFKGEKGDKGEKGVDGKDGERGADGKSAYQQAVEAGYNKSESEFASDLSKISGNSYTDDDKAWVDEIPSIKETIDYLPDMLESKQDVLTLTTKPNGNIVIGNLAGQTKEFMPATPSGDPMHYAYENLGALYNASDLDTTFIGVYGETIVHKANHWRLNDLGDISSEEMQKIFNTRYPSLSGYYLSQWFGGNGGVTTNICNTHWSSSYDMHNCFVNNIAIKSISLAANVEGVALPQNLSYAFYAATSLHTIINTINLTWATLQTSTFGFCYSLKNIRLLNLHSDISFADSPLLSKESLLYMIDNCTSDATFTITLHPDVYDEAKDSWNTEIEDAIKYALSNRGTTIGLTRA